MELWDIYDEHRRKTGKTMVRGNSIENGNYHLVVHVCIFNSKNQMLIQQRQPFKEGWSNLWDVSVGGSAIQGDNSQTAAEREVLEEIGYQIDLSNIRPHLTINFNGGFDDIYLIEKEIDLTTLQLQYEEVQQVKWANKKKVLELLEDKQFIPYYKSLIELLFDMQKQHYGSIIE